MEFVTKTTVRGGSEEQPVKIVRLDRDIARFWHNRIQPFVRDASAKRFRSDAKWHWPVMLHLFPRVELLAGRRCYGFAVMGRARNGDAVPVAMSLLVEEYALLEDEDAGSFLWFAASAPDDAFRAFDVPRLDRLGRILVNTTMVTSYNAGLLGRMSLHADPGGDAYLPDFYLKHCGLLPVNPSAKLRSIRNNDGRYYYATVLLAEKLLRSMNSWRE